MTTATEIRAWLKKGRSLRLDWLANPLPLSRLATSLVAMANSAGGHLVLGIADNQIVGVRDGHEAADNVIQVALEITPPLILPIPKITTVSGKTLVIVQIPAGMPHVYAYEGRYLQRIGSDNAPLSPQELRRLLLARGDLSFETTIAPGALLADIDMDKAEQYARGLRGFSNEDVAQILLRRGCLARQGKSLRPTYAGILLFGKDPQRYMRGADITAVRFAGEGMTDTFTRQDITGTLPDQIQRAETFLLDHLRKMVTLTGTMARQEQYEYPLEAARELIVNAVAHRDYSISGDNIHLFIFSNRMEVHSPGKLPGHMTVQNLLEERFSRNPVIVQVLSDMAFIERLGYGVDRVLELMQRHRLRVPEFAEREGGFRVVLHNSPPEYTDEDSANEFVFEGEYKGVYHDVLVNPRQEVALAFVEANSRITNSDLKNLFADVHPETIRRDLADLVNKNLLVKLGEKRGSYYVLRSVLES